MNNKEWQNQKAEKFLALHHAPPVLILANAWDVVSARIFEVEGFKAIGTTSAGISASLGYPDGQRMSLAENMEIVKRIVNSTSLPVSADIEAGYASSIEGVVFAALAVLKTGAVGLNLEDSTLDPVNPLFEQTFQAQKIQAVREMSVAEGIHLFINARTDEFLFNNDIKSSLRNAIERGNAYKEAGADCVFVPDVGNLDKRIIEILVKEIDAPINLIAGEATPPISELQEIGVSRVSLGPRPMRAALSLLKEIAIELRTTGTYKLMTKSTISYSEINQWFA